MFSFQNINLFKKIISLFQIAVLVSFCVSSNAKIIVHNDTGINMIFSIRLPSATKRVAITLRADETITLDNYLNRLCYGMMSNGTSQKLEHGLFFCKGLTTPDLSGANISFRYIYSNTKNIYDITEFANLNIYRAHRLSHTTVALHDDFEVTLDNSNMQDWKISIGKQ